MLREEQIDIRKQRAKQTPFRIENRGKNRVFSEFQVTNPESGGCYVVNIRGFETGDNSCTCPDFRSNTLGTCKHIEAVLEHIKEDAPEAFRKRKAAITKAEVSLDYSTPQLRLRLQIPPRHSDALEELAKRFFDEQGYWNNHFSYHEFIPAAEQVPETVSISSDALDFIDRELDRIALLQREKELLAELDAGSDSLRHLLKVPLYDYQIRGALFLACRGRSILGDDMGLGKTVQTLAAIELLARERGISKVLVVAPASVKYQWETEIRKFTDRSVLVVEGLKESRENLYQSEGFFKLVNYEQVVRDLDSMNAWLPDVIVLDEAQRIKNWTSKTSRSVKKLQSRYAIVLTGTPLENRLEELYSIVQFVDNRRLGPAFEFLHEHRVLDEQQNLIGYRNLDKLRDKLAPILLRRTRSEVLGQLPARTDQTIVVELSPVQKNLYDEQRTTLARLLAKNYLSELDRKRILSCLVNLRLICNASSLFDKQWSDSPKLEEFAEIIRETTEGGTHKAVVFSQWEGMIRLAAEVLNELKIPYVLLHGGLSGAERRTVLEQFQKPEYQFFLSTDAGGVGLNLQQADTVINLELPWNPAVLEQRIARVHRMGQIRPVRVIHFVTRGTIEERIQKILSEKLELFAGLFEGESDEFLFQSVADTSLLDGIRELVGDEAPSRKKTSPAEKTAPYPVEKILDSLTELAESLNQWPNEWQLDQPKRLRLEVALKGILERLENSQAGESS